MGLKSFLSFLLGVSSSLIPDLTLKSYFSLTSANQYQSAETLVLSVTMAFLTGIAIVLALLGAALGWYIRVPSDMPKNIPRVPIYVSLLGLWSDMGQDEIYARWLAQPLEKYGAVKIWFAGRWNVLATKPEFLTDMFRNEDIYAKAGSQIKIPWSVIASLVGDNIINTHDNWKLYTSIMKPGMQKRNIDTRPLLDMSRRFVDLLLREQSMLGNQKGVLVNPLIQRYAIAVMGEGFLDIDFHVCPLPIRCCFPSAAYE